MTDTPNLDVLQPEDSYAAWVDASDPVKALFTWDTITIVAHGTSGRNGEVDRRTRARAINARKRAIESYPWVDGKQPVTFKLTLIGKSYSETYGFMHASYFTYRITRGI